MSRRLRVLAGSVPMTLVVLSLMASSIATPRALAQQSGDDSAPSGGGYGCKSNGNCFGTLYKDKSNLDKWWYEVCSGCHVVQAPRPPDAQTTLTRFQRDMVTSRQRFWAFHADAAANPVLRRLTPKTRMVPTQQVRSPYRELLNH